jgi:hypothetical protein
MKKFGKGLKFFSVGVGMIVLAFFADSFSTLSFGHDALAYDLNPLIRGLSLFGYIVWSVIRMVIALGLLYFFWPGELREREWLTGCKPWAFILMPFPYRITKEYIITSVVLVIGPLKLVAACYNFLLYLTDMIVIDAIYILVTGIVLGFWIGNLIIFQYQNAYIRHKKDSLK